MAPTVHYYVWYRVAGEPADAQAAVDALLHDVFRHAGVLGRVLVRRDDPRTWMEIYEHVGDTALFERELVAAVERHGVARFALDGRRHTEPFVARV
jgi:hypothetical protein